MGTQKRTWLSHSLFSAGCLCKWTLLGLAMGGLVGLVGTAFSWAVETVTALRQSQGWLLYLLPLLLFLIGYLAAYTLGGWSAAIGVGGFVLGLLPAVVYDRKLKKRPPAYTIIGFVK